MTSSSINIESQNTMTIIESQSRVTDLESQNTVTDLESQNTVTDLESQNTVTDIESQNTVTDIESQNTIPVNLSDTPLTTLNSEHELRSGVFGCVLCLLIVILFPFTFCDLYYAFNSISCQNDPTGVGFTLATWLQVLGFYTIGMVVFMTICNLLSFKYECFVIIITIMEYVSSLFSFAWLIVGCVIFWKYLEPSGNCSSDISNYMWTRLIIGIILYVSTIFQSKKQK
jgi:hypothetical protein